MNKYIRKSYSQRLFPSTMVMAYYDHFSQIICLSSYKEIDFKKIRMDKLNEESISKLSIFEHELTHWKDNISTLWGQKKLVLVYNALNARYHNNPKEFWRIKYQEQNAKNDFHLRYYTTRPENMNAKLPWKTKISTGQRFDLEGKLDSSKPILFVSFISDDNRLFARTPISASTILETRAINAEFRRKYLLSHEIKDTENRNIFTDGMKKEMMSMLYNNQLMEYSVVAHLAAILLKKSDVVETYEITSAIGNIVLNLPSSSYAQMKLTNAGRLEWGSWIDQFQINKDIGFAFYNILRNLVDNNSEYTLDACLRYSNLPNKKALEAEILAEMQHNKEQLIEGPFKWLAINTIDHGIEMFKSSGIDETIGLMSQNSNDKPRLLPRVTFGDTDPYAVNVTFEEVMNKLIRHEYLTIYEYCEVFSSFENKISEFLDACNN